MTSWGKSLITVLLTLLLAGTAAPAAAQGFKWWRDKSIGFDRVMVSLGEFSLETKPAAAVICTPETRIPAYKAASSLRSAGITAVMDLLDRGFGAQLSSALKSGASFAVVIGEKEAAAGTITLKDLSTAVQTEMSLESAIEVIHGSCR